MKRKLSDLISDNIKDYSDIKCYVCKVKLNSKNVNMFFNMPKNHPSSKYYCSQICYQFI